MLTYLLQNEFQSLGRLTIRELLLKGHIGEACAGRKPLRIYGIIVSQEPQTLNNKYIALSIVFFLVEALQGFDKRPVCAATTVDHKGRNRHERKDFKQWCFFTVIDCNFARRIFD